MDGAVLGPPVVALIAITGVAAWRHWRLSDRWRRGGTGVGMTADGVHEVTIVVHEGYHPNRIRVRAGTPVRIVFDRQEADPCSARVFFSEPRIDRALAPHAATTVNFTPERVGDHLFTCEEGRFRGHLIVAPPEEGSSPPSGLGALTWRGME